MLQQNTSFVVTNMCLSRQNKSFVTTKVCLSWQNICLDIFLTNICCDKHNFVKHMFVMTYFSQQIFYWDKNIFVMTNVLSWQPHFCCNRRHVLSWQTCLLWQLLPLTVIIFCFNVASDSAAVLLLVRPWAFWLGQHLGRHPPPPPPTSPHHYCLLWSWVKLRGTLSLVCWTKCLRQNDS